MLNLIDQSDILKGLDDMALQREMQQPSGGAPPFLVLSEISRRKDMRQRYAGEMAMKAPTTTVAEDVLSAPAMPGMGAIPMGGQNAPMPGGIAAAAQMGTPPGGPGFASGGIVDAVDPNADYGALTKRYQSDLDALPADRNQAAALALLAAGAGIMGGGHSNFGQNLAVGIDSGVTTFNTALKATDARETNALRGLSDLVHDQHGDALQRLQLAQEPNDVRTFQFRQGLPPDQQEAFDDTVNPNAAFKRDQLVAQSDQVQQISDDIASGKAPPVFSGLYHLAPAVKADLGKRHPEFDVGQAQQAWTATQRLMSTLNGPGQVRLKQAIDFTDLSIDKLAELADQWNGGQFPILNKGNLMLALQGAKGQEAQSLAARLEAQRKEVISELATVYKGGNSPTDEGLKLAETQFDSAWSKGTFADAVQQAKQNILYRKASLDQLAGGVGANNPYAPDTSGAPVTAGDASHPAPVAAPVDDETNALVDKWLK